MSLFKRLRDGRFRQVDPKAIERLRERSEKENMPFVNKFGNVFSTIAGGMAGLLHLEAWMFLREIMLPLPSDYSTTVLVGASMIAFALVHGYVGHRVYRSLTGK